MTFPIFAAMGGGLYSNAPAYLNAMLPLAAGYNYSRLIAGENTPSYVINYEMYLRTITRWYAITGNDYSGLYKVLDNDYNTSLILSAGDQQSRVTAFGRHVTTGNNAKVLKLRIKNMVTIRNTDAGYDRDIRLNSECELYYTTTNNVNEDRFVNGNFVHGSSGNKQGTIYLGKALLFNQLVRVEAGKTANVSIDVELNVDFNLPDNYDGFLILNTGDDTDVWGRVTQNQYYQVDAQVINTLPVE